MQEKIIIKMEESSRFAFLTGIYYWSLINDLSCSLLSVSCKLQVIPESDEVLQVTKPSTLYVSYLVSLQGTCLPCLIPVSASWGTKLPKDQGFLDNLSYPEGFPLYFTSISDRSWNGKVVQLVGKMN